ncbi:hypothetical protein SAMN05518683_12542 [Salibacterium halotolerans]|uniref:Uncharacterized protein n=1 Tax=Salibacterium halotolerans TaxID=1884432 RepID=A0A1I5X784_9BACI|nr:hypothetical protein SAMN05518683_12542 [Salibacterium halotolerans]
MSCGVVHQSYSSGAKMLRLLLRTARVAGTPQDVRSGSAPARDVLPQDNDVYGALIAL